MDRAKRAETMARLRPAPWMARDAGVIIIRIKVPTAAVTVGAVTAEAAATDLARTEIPTHPALLHNAFSDGQSGCSEKEMYDVSGVPTTSSANVNARPRPRL